MIFFLTSCKNRLSITILCNIVLKKQTGNKNTIKLETESKRKHKLTRKSKVIFLFWEVWVDKHNADFNGIMMKTQHKNEITSLPILKIDKNSQFSTAFSWGFKIYFIVLLPNIVNETLK